jgi:predicted nucleic acid-binding protein
MATTNRQWPCVVDTNVFIRAFLENANDPTLIEEQAEAAKAIDSLLYRKHPLYTVPVILMEFWRVARRKDKGLNLSAEATRSRLIKLDGFTTCLLETPDVMADWRTLLMQHDLPSAQVYDAYIAAFLRTHPILQEQQDERGTLYPRLLTFKRQ